MTRIVVDTDDILSSDPLGSGESRPGGRRILHVPPLGLIYRLEPDGFTVTILKVWIYRPRRTP
jgi:hypothetical protein